LNLPGDDGSQVLARSRDEAGELTLRRRGEVLELIVDGVFAMDTLHTATEEALARLALARLGPRPMDVVVGGLGLGYTCRVLLAEPRVRRVTVIELHPALVEWVRGGLVPPAAGLLSDPRLQVRVADVLDAVPALPPASADAVLLDVDNGPSFLTHPGNAGVYAPPFLRAAARALRPGGILRVWSSEAAPQLALGLERTCGTCEEVLLDVRREGREYTYAVYLARREPRT
jgi:spermidine synthase